MEIFNQRNTLKQAIPFIALLVALNGICLSFITYLPITSLIFAFLLPLISIICIIYTKNIYYSLYSICSIILCFAICAYDISSCFLYLIPSLFSGLFMGICIKNRLDVRLTLSITVFSMTLLNIGFAHLTNLIFQINIFKIISSLFNFELNRISIYIYALIFIYTLAETLIMLLLSLGQIKKIYQTNRVGKINHLLKSATIFIPLFLSFLTFFIDKNFYIMFDIMAVTFCLIFLNFKEKTLQNSIILIVFAILTWIIYVACYNSFSIDDSAIILLIFPLLYSLYYLLLFLFKKGVDKV